MRDHDRGKAAVESECKDYETVVKVEAISEVECHTDT
jgi:hypothetical protein